MNNAIIFVSLAANQTEFYKKIAKELLKNKITVEIICCHERSYFDLKAEGLQAINFYKYYRKVEGFNKKDLESTCVKYGISSPILFCNHEKEFYKLKDNDLFEKMYKSLISAQEIMKDILKRNQGQVTFVQELGGFISVQSFFEVAKLNNITHYFLEPSFFKGRVFYVKNQLEAHKVNYNPNELVEDEMLSYIRKVVRNSEIVIPIKDKHHYQNTLKKFFNFHNLKRLIQKLYDKYVLNYDEEFKYVGNFSKKHLFSIINNLTLKSSYSEIPDEPFIYYPLHVPADVALTIRSTAYVNQLYLIEEIAKSLPLGVKICIKEHPAMIGAMSANKIKNLLVKRDTIAILNPSINNFEILKKCEAVYTVNSKAGAEATLFGKSVYVFGDAFYLHNPNVKVLDSVQALYGAPPLFYDEEANYKFFQNVWNNTKKGEIYALSEDNIENFSNSMLELVL